MEYYSYLSQTIKLQKIFYFLGRWLKRNIDVKRKIIFEVRRDYINIFWKDALILLNFR